MLITILILIINITIIITIIIIYWARVLKFQSCASVGLLLLRVLAQEFWDQVVAPYICEFNPYAAGFNPASFEVSVTANTTINRKMMFGHGEDDEKDPATQEVARRKASKGCPARRQS